MSSELDDVRDRLNARIERLEGLLDRAQFLFAHGVGAMTDNGDKPNQERNIDAAKALHMEIRQALSEQKP